MNAFEVKFTKSAMLITFPKQLSVQNEGVSIFDPRFTLYWCRETINAGEI